MIHRLGLALLSGVLAVCAFVCAFAASASYGQSSVGERVDKTINELGQTAHDVADQIRETFERAGGSRAHGCGSACLCTDPLGQSLKRRYCLGGGRPRGRCHAPRNRAQ